MAPFGVEIGNFGAYFEERNVDIGAKSKNSSFVLFEDSLRFVFALHFHIAFCIDLSLDIFTFCFHIAFPHCDSALRFVLCCVF